jgi:GST-like protein
MIDAYSWPTPNGRKVHVMLEETGLEWTYHPVDISKDEQFDPAFLKISPNNKIPAIIDHDGFDGKPVSVFESGAILIYLAEKTGKFMPTEPRERLSTLEWLMFQMGGVGPMFGQANHFRRFAKEEVPYGIKRYTDEAHRLYRVMDKRLGECAYLAGDDYTIADIATFPWVARYEWHGIALEDIPNVKRWFDAISARPAVAAGMAVPDTA